MTHATQTHSALRLAVGLGLGLALVIVALLIGTGYGSPPNPSGSATPVGAPSNEIRPMPEAAVVREGVLQAQSEVTPTATPQGLLVVVRDSVGEVLPSTAIHVKAVDRWRQLGVTDPNGEFRLASRPSHGIEIAATKKGYRAVRQPLSEPVPESIEIVLAPGVSICGRVRTLSGSSPDVALRVLAVDREVAEYHGVFDRVAEDDPTVAETSASLDGDFCIEGLNADSVYVILTGGSGYLLVDPKICQVRPGQGDIELKVSRLYGALVEFVPDTRALGERPGRRLLDTWCQGASFISPTTLSAQLSGLDPALRKLPEQFLLCLYTSEEARETLGPVQLDHEFAGFERGHESLQLGPVGKELPTWKVPLRALPCAMGSLELRFTRPPSAARGEVENSDRALAIPLPRRAILELHDDQTSPLVFELDIDPSGAARIESVPVGRYSAKLVAGPMRFPGASEPEQYLDVSEGANVLDVSLTGLAGLRLELETATGAPYSGEVMVWILRAGASPRSSGRSGQIAVFGGNCEPPYEFAGLAPGSYTIMMQSPVFRDANGANRVAVELIADRTTVVRARRSPTGT